MTNQNWGRLQWIVLLLAIASLGALTTRLWPQGASSVIAVSPTSQASLTQPPTPQTLATRWVVSAPEAKALIESGATLLDARGDALKTQSLAGAIVVTWRQFSQPNWPYQGNLLTDDAQLTQALQAIGVWRDRPVVVVADPIRGWGEDGRIVWMLRTLGHTQAVLVDGGYAALTAAGIPQTGGRVTVASTPGDVVVQRTPTWDMQQDRLRAGLDQGNLVILDAREPREFEGQTPYQEKRGGHIPGAISLYFKDVLDDQGYLLPKAQLLALLAEKGITSKTEIVSYCTGGIRSAWLTAVLIDQGFQAKNYAGSIWEWSAGAADQFPLVKP